MSEGFGLLSPDFTILELNREAIRIDGRARGAVIGQSHWIAYLHAEASEIGRLYNKAMSERVPIAVEHHYDWTDGRVCTIRAAPGLDVQGEIVEWVGVHRDITDTRAKDLSLHQLAESTKSSTFMKLRQGKYHMLAELLSESGDVRAWSTTGTLAPYGQLYTPMTDLRSQCCGTRHLSAEAITNTGITVLKSLWMLLCRLDN